MKYIETGKLVSKQDLIEKGGPGSGVYERTPKEQSKPAAGTPAAVKTGKIASNMVRPMQDYMNGFHKNLSRENERAYAVDRSNQLINGQARASGMSAKYDMPKQRARQYEMLVYKIFIAGRRKLNA